MIEVLMAFTILVLVPLAAGATLYLWSFYFGSRPRSWFLFTISITSTLAVTAGFPIGFVVLLRFAGATLPSYTAIAVGLGLIVMLVVPIYLAARIMLERARQPEAPPFKDDGGNEK